MAQRFPRRNKIDELSIKLCGFGKEPEDLCFRQIKKHRKFPTLRTTDAARCSNYNADVRPARPKE
jgi:hypothetical protein